MLLTTVNVPAFVVNRYRDVLAANALAQALSPLMVPGVNRLRALFTDPAAQLYHPDWAQNTAAVVAQLRAEAGANADDLRLQALVGELSVRSERFRELWGRHDVRRGGGDTVVIHHPEFGDLELGREKLAIVGSDGLLVTMYHAEPRSRAAQALERLATNLAGDRSTERAGPASRAATVQGGADGAAG